MPAAPRHGLRVDRARLLGGMPGDRERLAGALDSISLGAIGLPPQAVLIVRRLAPRGRLPRQGAAAPFVLGVQEELRRRVAGARRGRRGHADEDLLFEDEADFEAAIVADWLEGSGPAAGRWWAHVIEEATPVLRWRRTILNDPDLLARVVVRLARGGEAAAWLAAFEPAELLAAARAVLEKYGAVSAVAALAARPSNRGARAASASRADLAVVAPEAMNAPRRDIAVLMAVAAVVVRRPAWIGTQAFARAVATTTHPAPPGATITAEAPRPPARDRGRAASAAPAEPTPEKMRSIEAPAAASPYRDAPRARDATLAPKTDYRATAPVVATEFGGLFFLLNVFLALGLYGDFTRPADGLKGLSPFELLLLLAKRWFGAAFDADPLAEILRELAGLQPGERPGRLFEAPAWTVPEAWLRPWPQGKGGYPFILTDDPQVPRTAAWRRRRWVACLARYLQARIGRALGEKSGRAAVVVTCRQPGRITREHDRIEVHFPLADHPIALRLAGVDRDPGWIPAAGRFVEFRFV